MEVEIPNTDIEILNSTDIEVITNVDVLSNVSNDLEITFDDNEYSIVGDDMVVMTNYDDAPQWLKDTIGNIVNIKTAIAIGDLDATKEALDVMLSELEVAKNTYELSIISSEDIDERITTAITTLNSSLSEADATILQIAQTAVTPEEATAISINTLSASLSSNGTIGSAIHQLNVAMSTLESTTAESLSYLSSTMEGEINGNAEAMQTIRTYVGIDEDGNNTGVGLLADVAILQKQNDGVIETYTGTYDVMIGIEDPNNNTDNDQLDVTKEPYASWLAEDVANSDIAKRSAHIGDVYIKYSNSDSGYKSYERAYKFIRTVVDGTSPYATDSKGFTWSLIVDTDAQNAYVAALNAYDLADDKRRIFVGLGATSTPSVPYDQGDLWLIDAARVVNGYSCKVGDILRCVETKGKIGVYEQNDWVLASSYANAVAAEAAALETWKNTTYASTIATIQTQVDGKAETFYQSSIPTGRIKSINVPTNSTLDKYVGDLWKNTYAGTISGYLGDNTEYIYTKVANGSNWNYDWVKMEVPDIVFDTIDTKKSIYSGNSVPVAVYPDVIEVNDMWIPSTDTGSYKAGEVYIYNGTTWVVATKYTANLEAVRTNLQGQLDGKVETYYQATVPTGMTALNNGDYWYCTADVSTYKKGKVYKYVHATTSWVETADVSRYAFEVADGKAAIFSSANLPTSGYNINDMLIVVGSFNNGTTTFADGVVLSSTADRTSGFTPADWVKKINDTEDLDAFVSGTYTPTVASLQSQVDGQISYYFFDSSLGQSAASVSGSSSWTTDALKKEHNGDIAYDTKLELGYWYDRSVSNWVQITGAQNAGVIEALKKAAAAKEAADSVVVSYYAWKQTTAPATQYKWMKDDNTLWEYVGSAWVAVDVKKDDTLTAYNNTTKDTTLYVHNGSTWAMITPNGIVANAKAVTDLNASLSSLGTTVSGHTSLLNTVDARIGTEGARVETKFAYNSMLMLNGASYSSGFGIATSLTSGSGLPTGQSEFWIKADKFKLMSADGTKKSSYSPFTVDATTGDITFNGKVSFNSVTNAPSISSNLLYNSEPSLYGGTKGYVLGYNDTGITAVIGQDVSDWAPSGSSSIYIYSTGTPAPNTVFDINSEKRTPIVGGKTYCAYAYFGAHRCTAQLLIGFYDAAGAIISYTFGNEISGLNGGKSLSNYGHSVIKVVAPSNAASVLMIYRGKNTTSANPYVFVVRSYLGVIDSVNSETPEWSEGTSVTYTPSNVVSDINNGNTTTINGGRITTGSVTANQINTTGLIAENISANEIVGKTITGGSISGAIIEGSIIKASYLDLNGQLKVLTDYIISVAMYNANPSLYIDAVYISVYNNYRIPTLSVVKESNSVFTNIYLAGSIYNGSIFSYSTANAGTLLKAQKIRPTVTVLENTDIISSVSYQPWWYNINYHVCNHFRLSLNGITLIEVHVAYQSRAGGPEGNLEYSVTNISGNLISPINITRHRDSDSTYTPLIYNLDLGIKDVVLQHTCTTGGGAGYGWNYNFNTEIKITLNSGTRIMPFDWTSGNIKFEQLVNANGSNSFTLKNIQITNLDL